MVDICEVRPVMAQNAVNRHESTYTYRRAAIVMTTYPSVLNPHDAPSYGHYFFFFVSLAYVDPHHLVLIPILLIHSTGLLENINLCHHKNLTKFIDAQNTDISVSADGDFGEMKKTETPSKGVGRNAQTPTTQTPNTHTHQLYK